MKNPHIGFLGTLVIKAIFLKTDTELKEGQVHLERISDQYTKNAQDQF